MSSVQRMLRMRDVKAATGLSKSTILDKVRMGDFPMPIKITDSGRSVGWLEGKIVEWQQSRATSSSAPLNELLSARKGGRS